MPKAILDENVVCVDQNFCTKIYLSDFNVLLFSWIVVFWDVFSLKNNHLHIIPKYTTFDELLLIR
jgi:hypothetical protein